MHFITLINEMTNEEVKNLKFDFSWITLVYMVACLTLIYPAHFEDVPCQSGVNHIFEGWKIMYLDKAYIIVKRNV